MNEAKPVSTPGESANKDAEPGDVPLDERQASRFRSMAARANYLAADRVDIMYSVKEMCRGMANPEEKEMVKMKRLARYLKGNGRLHQIQMARRRKSDHRVQ